MQITVKIKIDYVRDYWQLVPWYPRREQNSTSMLLCIDEDSVVEIGSSQMIIDIIKYSKSMHIHVRDWSKWVG
jgi:hypothetical protein